MGEHPISQNEIENRVYIGPKKTGDNIDAKRQAGYVWDNVASQWVRASSPSGLVQGPYDSVSYTNTSTTVDTYKYYNGGLSGTLVATLTITYTDTTKDQISNVVRT